MARTTVEVEELPLCDIHNKRHPAAYDFKTFQGPWAYGCEKAWKENRAHHDLGVGKGQRLVVRK